jgi:hypothetical protein
MLPGHAPNGVPKPRYRWSRLHHFFSWSVMRETRSLTLSVIVNDGFRNGAFAITDAKSSEDSAGD